MIENPKVGQPVQVHLPDGMFAEGGLFADCGGVSPAAATVTEVWDCGSVCLFVMLSSGAQRNLSDVPPEWLEAVS